MNDGRQTGNRIDDFGADVLVLDVDTEAPVKLDHELEAAISAMLDVPPFPFPVTAADPPRRDCAPAPAWGDGASAPPR